MTPLASLKIALREEAKGTTTRPLTESQYSIGLETITEGAGQNTYRQFILPQLAQLLALFPPQHEISILEVGPGPKSVLGRLPNASTRRIKGYTAFEPNESFAASLEDWLSATPERTAPLPSLSRPPKIHREPFHQGSQTEKDEKFNVVLFCHSMYGMKDRDKIIQRALEMVANDVEEGFVVVFHRAENLHFSGKVCHRIASFPNGLISVPDEENKIDAFASFIAGFTLADSNLDETIRTAWRKTCRNSSQPNSARPSHLLFRSPEMMFIFRKSANALPELAANVPFLNERIIINGEASSYRPAAIARPTTIRHVQDCVRWALKHRLNLTVIGGSHGGYCVQPNIVAIDMSAFDQIDIVTPDGCGSEDSRPLIVAGAGCKTGDIVKKGMAAGLTVPLGSRPSVGAGLWLQGGIGHLSRLYGLTCDAIVGAVMVCVESGKVIVVGNVPCQHQPEDALCIGDHPNWLWVIRGAGTNFGIILSVVFKSHPSPTLLRRLWICPCDHRLELQLQIRRLDELISNSERVSRDTSTDI